jgi:four helix bundle protein
MALAMRVRMPKIQSFRDLIAWQKAMDLADMIYDITEHFPPRELFGLAYQMRKSAVSIPSNIAEGSRRKTPGYVHHLTIALGSHAQLDTQCELASRRRFIAAENWIRLEDLIAEVGRVTHGLARSLDSEYERR